jgi:hypothetical protein
MPSFVIVSSLRRQVGRTVGGITVGGIMCDPGVAGSPDRCSATAVKVTISEKSLKIDDELLARAIISTTGINGVSTFFVDRSTKMLRDRERHAAQAQALAQQDKLRDCLVPLKDESESPELATDGLGLLYNWIAEEPERLAVAPRSMTERQRAHQTTANMNTHRRTRSGP